MKEKIKRKRIYLRETQRDFGKRFGMSAMGVSYVERGKRRPNLKLLDYMMKEDKTTSRSMEGRICSMEAKINEICEILGLSKL